MPTLTLMDSTKLASVTEDSLVGPAPAPTRVGFNYANFLTAGNESSDTDGFLLTGKGIGNNVLGGSVGANTGKLFINTGTTTTPVYKELVQGTYSGVAGATVAGDFNTASINTSSVTIRLTGVFIGNVKVSGSDSKLYWEPNLAPNVNGIQPAFYVRSADNTNSTWLDGGDLVSSSDVLVSINVLSSNDAPVFTLGADVTVAEDSGAYSASIASAIGPGGGPDEAAQVVTMSVIGNTNGALFAGAVTVDNAGNLMFTPAANASGSAMITVQAMDNGGTANGGQDTTTHTFNITVTPVNDAPVNVVPGAQGAVAQHVVFSTGNGNALSVTDVDAASGTITVTLGINNGGTVAVTASGGAIVTNSGTSLVTISGTLTAVNASLQGADAHAPVDAVLTMTTNDGGNTGSGGAMMDTDMVTIGVAPTVLSVTEPAAGLYSVANGNTAISYVVTYDSAVNVTGAPSIAVDVGGTTRQAVYASGSGTTAITFTYTVVGADNDADGVVASSPIVLNGGTISSTISATSASLVLVGLDPTPAVIVDNTAPTVPTALDLLGTDDTGASTTDNYTKTNASLHVSGSGENGATVRLFDDVDNSGTFNGGDVTLGTAAVAGGAWSVTTGAALADGVHNVRADAVDAALNRSAASGALAITIDTVPPAAPTALDLATADDTGSSTSDNITSVNTALTITGSAAANAVVTILDGAATLGTATANGAGNFTFDTGLFADGVHSITATQVDLAGNVSIASTALNITVDTTAPTAPSALNLATADDSAGTSNTDNITFANANLTFDGTGENGSVVTLFDDVDSSGTFNGGDTNLGTATVAGGVWSLDAAGVFADGVHNIRAFATDAAGNNSAASAALAVTVDTIAPTVPAGLDLAAGDDTGASATDNYTKTNNSLHISGTGENASIVRLFDDVDNSGAFNGGDVSLGTATVAGGVWTVTSGTALADGVHNIRADATDVAGNQAAASAALAITIDTVAPAAPTGLDLATADDTGSSTSDNITSVNTALTITGSAAANAVVTVLDGAVSLGTATADGAGNFTFDTGLFADGVHSITATQVDLAGNVSAASTALPITVDTTAPTVPGALNLAAADDTGVSATDNITKFNSSLTFDGTGENGSVVTLFDDVDSSGTFNGGDTNLGTATVAGGVWSRDAAGVFADGVHNIRAFATDTAGNNSAASSALAVTVDTSAPAAPSAPDLFSGDDTGVSNSDNITKQTTGLTFSGTAEANSTVSLFIDANNNAAYDNGEQVLGTGVAGGGNWSFDSSTLTNGTYIIRAFATDVAGNQGTASVGASLLTVQVDTVTPSAPTLDLDVTDDSGVSGTDNITNVTTNLTLNITGEANATVTVSQGVTVLGTATLNGAGTGTYDVVGPVAPDGVYAYTATQTDVAGNTSLPSSALNITIDTVGPSVTYDGAVYDSVTNKLTISGTGFNGLGAANVTALVVANAGDLTWDVDGGGADYSLAGADISSATVTDDRTLVIVLNQTANIDNLEMNGFFGSTSATVLNPLDSIAILATFVGTDLAGNPGSGSTLGIEVLGAQNEGGMPHSFSINLAVNDTVVDDTLGEDAGAADLVSTTATDGGLWVAGNSAAQLQVEALGVGLGGNNYILTQLSVLGVGTGNAVLVNNATLGTEVTFADGSKLVSNDGGASNTLTGGTHDDQLIASDNGDRLLGNAGNDLLIGGDASDAIYGGSGNDMIYGGLGSDYLSGGSGNDTYFYSAAADGEGYDVITGFSSGDVIDVAGAASAAAIHAMAVASGSDTLIVLNGTETIRLLGVAVGSLTDANFSNHSALINNALI